MTEPFPELSFFANQALVLALVIILKWISNKTTSLNTFGFFRLYCQLLANKVNKANNSPQQQLISGWLSLLITYLTLIIIVWLFEAFIEVVWLWHALLLFLSLDSLQLNSTGRKLAQALVANRNYEAKQLIQPQVLRECQRLSTMGLCKSFIEARLLKLHQHLLVPSILFLTFGPYLAFSYRLILEMHHCWNIKQPRLKHFGRAAATIINLLQWLPTRFISLLHWLLTLNSSSALYWRLTKQHIFKFNNDVLIHLYALTNEIRLGGVAMYGGEKLRKLAFNDKAKQPEPKDIIHTGQQLIRLLIGLSIVVICSVSISILANN